MLTFFSFIIVMLGSINWFFIGAFQYDFIAGLFGLQASIFSRLLYFIIGMSAFVLLTMAIKNRGVIKLTENSFKKEPKIAPKQEKKDDDEEKENSAGEDLPEQKPNFDFPKPTQSKEGYKDFDASKYDNL